MKKTNEVIIQNAQIAYSETGPNKTWVNIITVKNEENNSEEFRLVMNIDQSEVGNAFACMAQGKLVASVELMEGFKKLKQIVDNQ